MLLRVVSKHKADRAPKHMILKENNTISKVSEHKPQPYYFMVVVWGENYVDQLANFCIPSLLALGNIPALHNDCENRFLVVTTPPDWVRLNSFPIVNSLAQYVTVTYCELPCIRQDTSVYDHLNRGHEIALKIAFANKAYGVLLTPDLMFSDGSIAAVQRYAEMGAKVVLSAALRFGQEPLFEQLESMGIVSINSNLGRQAKPLAITGKEMARAGVNSFHNEMLRFEWDAPYFAPFYTGMPGSSWWHVPGEDGVLLYTSSWMPVLMDYAALADHDLSTLNHWAIDGDYVYRNFGDKDGIHISQDSDEIMFVSWTSMSVLNLSRKSKWYLSIPKLGDFFKVCMLRNAFLGPTSDPLKRKKCSVPVRLHAHQLNDVWVDVEERSQKIIARCLLSTDKTGYAFLMWLVGVTHRTYVLVSGRWYNRHHISEVAMKALLGDQEARIFIIRRTRLYLRQLLGKSVGDD